MRSKRLLGCFAVLSVMMGFLGGCDNATPPSTKTAEKPDPNKSVPISATSATVATVASVSATPPLAISATTANEMDKGKALYAQSCHVCHDTGALNAPRLGDKSAWEDRIAQGKDTLYKHAINGFTGKVGTMPPKGGSNAPDTEIKSAVDYMVSKVS